jgi:hypothetical protein
MPRKSRSPSDAEIEKMSAEMLAVLNRPWDMWEAELRKRFDLQDKNRKRQVGIASANDSRQQRAEANYRLYREIAVGLIAESPALRRATQHRLAQRVQTELVNRGRRHVSTRTIERALTRQGDRHAKTSGQKNGRCIR